LIPFLRADQQRLSRTLLPPFLALNRAGLQSPLVASASRGWPLLRVEVAEESMLPALRPGDWLLARRTRRIRPGQVVLAWHPGRPGFLLVKRATRRVDGGWWLESDNPAAGAVDSNRLGPVRDELIVGRVLARYGRRSRSLPSPERLRCSALVSRP
jgi:nickel-type superoxide dismutase maturation protease